MEQSRGEMNASGVRDRSDLRQKVIPNNERAEREITKISIGCEEKQKQIKNSLIDRRR